jgi:hypothetical protein
MWTTVLRYAPNPGKLAGSVKKLLVPHNRDGILKQAHENVHGNALKRSELM